MANYGVLGRGSQRGNGGDVIIAGLSDTLDLKADRLHIPWMGKPIPPDMETVYDWVLDNEMPFFMYAENVGDVPKAFCNTGFGDIQEGDPVEMVLQRCTTLLYLWDSDQDGVLDRIDGSKNSPSLVLDLTTGLIPIEFVSETEQEETSDVPRLAKDDDDDEVIGDMTREELEIMPALAVKRYANAKLGQTFATKSAAIDALFPLGEVDEEDPTDDAPSTTTESDNIVIGIRNTFALLATMIAKSAASVERDQALLRLQEAMMWSDQIPNKES
jgi:hypothetical protein